MTSNVQRSIGAVLGVLALSVLVLAPSAQARPSTGRALSPDECADLVEEGAEARLDLAKLIEGQADAQGSTGTTDTTTPEIASYVAELLESASINVFGFVSADAGAPLDLCLPEGASAVTMFSTPVVLWQGLATADAYPVTVTVPADTACGTHTLQATGAGVDQSVEFVVEGACASDSGASGLALPRTGAEIVRAVAIALSLIAIGYAVVSARRTWVRRP